MSYYSIEINYSLNNLSMIDKHLKIEKSTTEIRQIAKETNGIFCAFDFDIALTHDGPNSIGGNYNWKYKNLL